MHKSVCLKPFLSQESKFPLLLLMHSQFDFWALSSLFYCYWQQGSFKESVFCSVSHHFFYKFLGWSWKRWWTADTLKASGKKLVHFQLDFSLNFIFPTIFVCLPSFSFLYQILTNHNYKIEGWCFSMLGIRTEQCLYGWER